ncbi:MAG TPA: apolipoprotein N-acyltransferase [Rhodothermales bacterium]|nr:apolipoprotein N-acyltransferase [Rhodothermales bacterium]
MSPRPHYRLLLILGGGALGLAFPPFPWPWLAYGALIPLLVRWEKASSWRRALLDAYVFFLATFAVAFSWPLFHVMPNVALASLTGTLVLPLWMAVPFGLGWIVRRRLGRYAGMCALAAFYLVMEAALQHGPFAMPWPLLGHTQAEALVVNQFADLTGTSGLTLWVLLLNLALYLTLSSPGRTRRLASAAAAALLLAGALVYSAGRLHTLETPGRSAWVALVQPGTAPLTWADLGDPNRLPNLLSLTDSLLSAPVPEPDLVIWPETAIPLVHGASSDSARRQLQAWADRNRVALLTGAITRTSTARGQPAYHNAALLLRPDAPPRQYDKRRLVAFAERVPFLDRFPALASLAVPAGGVYGYEPGTTAPLLRTSQARFGVLICLETVFGSLGRQYAREGADFLVAITQDGWWRNTAGYRQHLAFTRLRAIENRRAVVQVSVSGLSALIGPDGKISHEIGWMRRSAETVNVPLSTGTTFFTRHGDWITPLAAVFSLILILLTLSAPLLSSLHKSQPATSPLA